MEEKQPQPPPAADPPDTYHPSAVAVTLTGLIRKHLKNCLRTIKGVDCPDLGMIVDEWARKIAKSDESVATRESAIQLEIECPCSCHEESNVGTCEDCDHRHAPLRTQPGIEAGRGEEKGRADAMRLLRGREWAEAPDYAKERIVGGICEKLHAANERARLAEQERPVIVPVGTCGCAGPACQRDVHVLPGGNSEVERLQGELAGLREAVTAELPYIGCTTDEPCFCQPCQVRERLHEAALAPQEGAAQTDARKK